MAERHQDALLRPDRARRLLRAADETLVDVRFQVGQRGGLALEALENARDSLEPADNEKSVLEASIRLKVYVFNALALQARVFANIDRVHQAQVVRLCLAICFERGLPEHLVEGGGDSHRVAPVLAEAERLFR